MRLQVFLSHNGVCSRRKALEVVFRGRVSVNGREVIEPSTEVDPAKDIVRVDGKEIGSKKYTYILLNKPAGYVTTKKDRFAEKTVFDLLPASFGHLAPVGRLDKDTEGLLLLTNDGGLAYRLTHPKFELSKVYFVRVQGRLEPFQKRRLEQGIVLEDGKTAPGKIGKIQSRGDQTEFCLTIHEGKKRQIRRMLAKVGSSVIYLKRIAHGPLNLGELKRGQWRELREREIQI